MTIEGRRAFVYSEGCFLGLQVLGDEVEPCFEGAAFFSLYKSVNELIKKLDIYEKNLNVPENNEGGKTKMFNFKLSDDAKYNQLFDLINPNYNEEGNYELNAYIIDVYDEYAVIFKCNEKEYERVYYTKNEDDEVVLGERRKCYIVDVTESEKNSLETIQALNGGNYELIEEKFVVNTEDGDGNNEGGEGAEDTDAALNELQEKFSLSEEKNVELQAEIATLNTEKEELSSQFAKATETIEGLNAELDALKEFKLDIELKEKTSVIDQYRDKLSEESIAKFEESIDTFTLDNLKKELAFEFVNSNPAIFSAKEQNNEEVIPTKNSYNKSRLETLLDKYEK